MMRWDVCLVLAMLVLVLVTGGFDLSVLSCGVALSAMVTEQYRCEVRLLDAQQCPERKLSAFGSLS